VNARNPFNLLDAGTLGQCADNCHLLVDAQDVCHIRAPYANKCITERWHCQEFLCYSIEIMKMLALLTLILFAQQPTKLPESEGISTGAGSQVSQQSNSPERKENTSNAASGKAQAATTNEHTTPAEEDIDIQGKLVRYTGFLVVVGLMTALAIIWQSYETRRAADAGNRNIEATMNERRARVEIIADALASGATGYVVSVSLRNGGPTIGTIRDAFARLVESSGSVEVDYGGCKPLGFTGTIAPASDTHNVWIVQDTATTQIGQSVIHFYGFARYDDVYQRTHKVQVHIQWGGNGVWIIAGKPEDNSDTEEKSPKKSWTERLDERLDRLIPPN
jgi:hypothetical protein